jgi:hypothetical protein
MFKAFSFPYKPFNLVSESRAILGVRSMAVDPSLKCRMGVEQRQSKICDTHRTILPWVKGRRKSEGEEVSGQREASDPMKCFFTVAMIQGIGIY